MVFFLNTMTNTILQVRLLFFAFFFSLYFDSFILYLKKIQNISFLFCASPSAPPPSAISSLSFLPRLLFGVAFQTLQLRRFSFELRIFLLLGLNNKVSK
jgi:hypothetical protein